MMDPATVGVVSEDREISIPEEADLTLLCLDYLRDLRRAYSPSALLNSEGIHADYLTVACWALNRAIDTAPTNNDEGNDCWKETDNVIGRTKLSQNNANALPSLKEMEDEILYSMDPHSQSNESNFMTRKHINKHSKFHSYEWYEYDDEHPSNQQRFYPLQGLASGPELPGPLTLGEMVTASLVAINARTRRQAELELEQSELFEQYIAAVQDQGFFEFPSATSPEERQALYEQRYQKVLAKFRLKLAQQALEDANPMEGYLAALTAAEHQRARREEKRLMALEDFDEKSPKDGTASDVGSNVGTEVSVASYVKRMSFAAKLFPTNKSNKDTSAPAASTSSAHNAQPPASLHSSSYSPDDLEEAENLKNQGNTFMQQKDYEAAASCYTKALKLSPAGPQSHVYFSNRAAALVSLRQFDKAILDSERSLSLQPTYAKAHARLGLAHFLMGNYEAARDAYEVALEYEPNNKSNQTYLEKAKKRFAEQQHDQPNGGIIDGHHHAAKIALVPSPSSKKQSSHGHHNPQQQHASSLKEAEKYKTKGNALMSSRDYEKALEAYTQALNVSSNGPQSHVYYSNRAAALCYLERYQEAEQDSLQSLDHEPAYGKAHARLGLSRFFLQDYAGAVSAYQKALEYDPDNAASQSYLVKAKAKLAKQEKDDPAAAAADKRRHKMDTGKSNPKVMKMANSHSASTKTASKQSLSVETSSPNKMEDMDITARRLLHDENLRTMATKAMANPSKDLLSDPEMHEKAKKAMAAMRK